MQSTTWMLYGNRHLMHIVHAAHGATYGRFTLEHAATIIRLVGGQKVCRGKKREEVRTSPS